MILRDSRRHKSHKNDVTNEDDAWDDTALIRAYDKAVGLVKANIAKRNQPPTNSVEGSESDSLEKKQRKNKPSRNTDWKVGSLCQAIYSEDGLIYPATIVEIAPGGETCTVEYVGYGNREEVKLKDLRVLRKKHYKKHTKNGDLPKNDFNDCPDNVTSHGSGEPVEGRCCNRSHHCGGSSNFFPPPPPPFPFMMPPFGSPWFPNVYHHSLPWSARPGMTGVPPPPPPPPVAVPESPDEALASTLMAWYMSGYHTGYYQAMKLCSCKGNQNKSATKKKN